MNENTTDETKVTCVRCAEKEATLKCIKCSQWNAPEETFLCGECFDVIHMGQFANHEFLKLVPDETVDEVDEDLNVDLTKVDNSAELLERIRTAKINLQQRLQFSEQAQFELSSMKVDINKFWNIILGKIHTEIDMILEPIRVHFASIKGTMREQLETECLELIKNTIKSSVQITDNYHTTKGLRFFNLIEQLGKELEMGALQDCVDVLSEISSIIDFSNLPKQPEVPFQFYLPSLVYPEGFTPLATQFIDLAKQITFKFDTISLGEKFDDEKLLKLFSACIGSDEEGNEIYFVERVGPIRSTGLFTVYLYLPHKESLLTIMEWHIRLSRTLVSQHTSSSSIDTPSNDEADQKDESTVEGYKSDVEDKEKTDEVALKKGSLVYGLRVDSCDIDKSRKYWSRAVVSEVHPASCLVYWLDHGNEDEVVHNRLFPAPPNFGEYSVVPFMAPICSLLTYESPDMWPLPVLSNLAEVNTLWNDLYPTKTPAPNYQLRVLDPSCTLRSTPYWHVTLSNPSSGPISEVVKMKDSNATKKPLCIKLSEDIRMLSDPSIESVHLVFGADKEEEGEKESEVADEDQEVIDPSVETQAPPSPPIEKMVTLPAPYQLVPDPLCTLRSPPPPQEGEEEHSVPSDARAKTITFLETVTSVPLFSSSLAGFFQDDSEVTDTWTRIVNSRPPPTPVVASNNDWNSSNISGTLFLMENKLLHNTTMQLVGSTYHNGRLLMLVDGWESKINQAYMDDLKKYYSNSSPRKHLTRGCVVLMPRTTGNSTFLARCLIVENLNRMTRTRDLQLLDLDRLEIFSESVNIMNMNHIRCVFGGSIKKHAYNVRFLCVTDAAGTRELHSESDTVTRFHANLPIKSISPRQGFVCLGRATGHIVNKRQQSNNIPEYYVQLTSENGWCSDNMWTGSGLSSRAESHHDVESNCSRHDAFSVGGGSISDRPITPKKEVVCGDGSFTDNAVGEETVEDWPEERDNYQVEVTTRHTEPPNDLTLVIPKQPREAELIDKTNESPLTSPYVDWNTLVPESPSEPEPQPETVTTSEAGDGTAPQLNTITTSEAGDGNAPQLNTITTSETGDSNAPQLNTITTSETGDSNAPQLNTITTSETGDGTAAQPQPKTMNPPYLVYVNSEKGPFYQDNSLSNHSNAKDVSGNWAYRQMTQIVDQQIAPPPIDPYYEESMLSYTANSHRGRGFSGVAAPYSDRHSNSDRQGGRGGGGGNKNGGTKKKKGSRHGRDGRGDHDSNNQSKRT